MKKLFGMIAIVLLFSSVVFAETIILSETMMKRDDYTGNNDWFKTATICVDGYKFVVVTNLGTESSNVSIVQFYEFECGKTVAAKC